MAQELRGSRQKKTRVKVRKGKEREVIGEETEGGTNFITDIQWGGERLEN